MIFIKKMYNNQTIGLKDVDPNCKKRTLIVKSLLLLNLIGI